MRSTITKIVVVIIYATLTQLFSTSAVPQVDFRWFIVPAMAGTLVAGVQNKSGSYFRISYTPDSKPTGCYLDYSPKTRKLVSGESIQVVVKDDAFHFSADKGGGVSLVFRNELLSLERLASALISTDAKYFTVELPRVGFSERFSLQDVTKTLGATGKTLVSDC